MFIVSIADDKAELILPMVEERARVVKRTVVTGRVRVRTGVESSEARLDETLLRQTVDVDRVPLGVFVEESPGVRQEGETLIIPVLEEVFVKRLFLREEVRITPRRTSEPFESLVALRRHTLDIDRTPAERDPLPPPQMKDPEMTNRTITAVFDSKESAERAKEQLKAQGVDHVDIHNEDAGATASAEGQKGGFLDRVAGFFGGHEDTHAYAEAARRGHYLLTAQVDDAHADRAVQLLDSSGAVDFDTAEKSWRSEGWTGATTATAATTAAQPLAATTSAAGAEDGAIQLVEERLKVGKREVERGGVRVRSYVVETPVQEQVALREEHVTIERRPVNEPVANAEALLQDRNLEFTETAEEAVIAKDAVVTEEVAIRKDVTQRTEEIHDTVRRTEVEIDDTRTGVSPTPR